MATLPFAAPFREATRDHKIDISKLNLSNLQPTVKRTLILAGLRDLFVPVETLDDLAKQWPRTDLVRMPHSHISSVFGAALGIRENTAEMRRFLWTFRCPSACAGASSPACP